MASTSSNIKDYSIDSYEYIRNVAKIYTPTPKTIKSYIPKYMPKIKEGNWKKPYPISLGTQKNASECKVKLPTKVTEQGYATLIHYDNETPNFKSKMVTDDKGETYIPIGSTFMAEVLYNDPTTIKFIGKV
jgi:hypothetical protein